MRIQDSPYHTAASDNPLVYPGVLPDFSYVYHQNNMYRLDIRSPLGASTLPDCEHITLDDFLKKHNAAPLDDRRPLAASGSNASPGQLMQKLRPLPDAVVPVIRARVTHLDTVYAAHMTRYGAIPATFAKSRDTIAHIHIGFFTSIEVECIDETEGNNYHRGFLSNKAFPSFLASGDPIDGYEAYIAVRGVIGIDDQPIRLARLKATTPRFRALTQEEMLKAFIRQWNRDGAHEQLDDIQHLLTQLHTRPAFIYEVNRWLRDHLATYEYDLLWTG